MTHAIAGFHKRIASVVALAALLAAGCGGDSTKTSSLTGTVSADGSSTVFPITEAVGEEFKKENSGVEIVVGASGTGSGFKKFCNGETDISDASRPIKDSEKKACAAKGIEYVELQVAVDGLAVLVSKENSWVECLTTDELKKIWSPKSPVDNWKEVRSEFPSEPMRFFSPGTDSGTFDYFTDEINGEEGASRNDKLVTFSEDDNTLVTGVAGFKGSLGYFGFAYYTQNTDKLKILGVDSGSGCITPSDSTVKDGTYKPLSRPLFIYTKKTALSRPEVKAFLLYYMKNVNSLVGDVGYTPISDSVLQQETTKLTAAIGG